MSRFPASLITIFAMSLYAASGVRAETYYVCLNGSCDYETIQDALNNAVDDDVIIVRDGTYTGPYNKNLDFHNKAVILRSEHGPSACTIDCEYVGRAFMFNGETESTIVIGFTITGGNTHPYAGGIYCINNSRPTIINCIIINNHSGHGAGMTNDNSNPRIYNCVFKNNTASGHGGGICNLNSNPTITNCTFTQNRSSTQPDGAIINHNNSNPIITNCIFWGDLWNGSPYPGEILNADSSSNPIIRYCCIQGCWPGDGNICNPPCFTLDEHLCSGSPCIDAGDTNALLSGLYVDLEGLGRVLDDACTPDTGIHGYLVPISVDMGAYEYQGLKGDLDHDNDVDLSDLAELLAHYGQACIEPHHWAEYDWHWNPSTEHWYALTLDGPVSWSDAESEAEAIGGTLVNINDHAEQDWLVVTFPYQEPYHPWIGLWQDTNDQEYSEPHGGWKWICGDPLTYVNWAPGEPNEAPPDETNEDRAQMNAFGPGFWQDVPGESASTRQRGIIEVIP